ncbi:hypothetical protein ACMYR3_00910 [Ampullimonas aquatilis]|uniref:hypothetical protein n=1 Tax=Ampullimonas aquatilis TaxID=1341549 RepID=UPI003C76C1A2
MNIDLYIKIFSKIILCNAFACTMLSACSSLTEQSIAIDKSQRLTGYGFSISAPREENWKLGGRKDDGIMFYKNPNNLKNSNDDVFYRLIAGVDILSRSSTLSGITSETDLFSHARLILAARLQVAGRQMILMEVKKTLFKGVVCTEYLTDQVDQYDPEKIDKPRYEYSQRGYLCLHPDSPKLLIQIFYTEHFLRTSPPLRRINASNQENFFQQFDFVHLN